MNPTAFAQALRETRVRLKLSQLELASRAGTSQRYVSFIERGRSAPGRDVVLRLGAALGVSLRERNQLLLHAGFAPAYSHAELEAAGLRTVRAALIHLVEAHAPFPALLIDRRGDIIAANAPCDVLAAGVAPKLLRAPMNLYRIALHPEGLAPDLADLALWSGRIRERLRAEAAQSPDPRLTGLLAELDAYAATGYPSLSPVGPEHRDPGYAVPLTLRSAHGELRLITTITTFSTATDVTLAELRLETFLPADEETARILSDLAARPCGRSGRPLPPGNRRGAPDTL
jgi:transcriptional regulator with XRE-family HTH domain